MPDRAAKVVVAYCCFHCNLLNRLPSQSIFSISLTIRKDTHSKGVYLFTFFNLLIFLRQLAEASLIFPIRQAFPVWSTVKQSKKKKKRTKKKKKRKREEKDENPLWDGINSSRNHWCHYCIWLCTSAGTQAHFHTCKWVCNSQSKCSLTCRHVSIHACWHTVYTDTHSRQGIWRNAIRQAHTAIKIWKTEKVNTPYFHYGIILSNYINNK